jgi:hypothetical protein
VKFAYTALPLRQPSPGATGGLRHRPLVPIHVVGPRRLPALDGCIDCAADDTVFPPHWATRLGVNLGSGPQGRARAVGGAVVQVTFAPVTLLLTDGHEICVGDVDLSWTPSAIASSYNIYRSTSSGTETLIAGGITDRFFFDTGLASDGTSYFYQVSAVNDAGESAATAEVSATPSAPAGLLFSDDFSNGPSSAWTFTPDTGYWLPQVGQLTDAGGDTAANLAQTATVALPAGTGTWQADLLTKEGHGAGIDTQGNPGISGISVQSADGLNEVWFSIFDNNSLNVGTVVGGAWQGWTRVGTAPTISHPSGPELLPHTYQIRLDSAGTFSLIFDGAVLSSGISAGPAPAWANGIGTGTLFTWSNLDDRHLSTSFDNVRALGLAGGGPRAATGGDAPVNLSWKISAGATSFNIYPAPRGGRGTPSAEGLTSTAFANFGLSIGTTYSYQVTVVNSAGETGPSNEVSAPARAMASVLAAPANLSATAGDGHVRLSQAPSARATSRNIYQGISGDGETFLAGEEENGVRTLIGEVG